MKKIKIRIFVLLLAVVSVASAFTAKKNYHKTLGTIYYWFDPTTDEYVGQNTLMDEVNLTGCNGSNFNPTCQKGFVQSHLISGSNPGLGHQAVAPDAFVNQYN